MSKAKRNILALVEGEKTDMRLMKRLVKIYGIENRHQFVSYNTNLYALYNSMFRGADPGSLDILLHLKEREHDPLKKAIFENSYSDILLIFDFDPQDPQFSEARIREMTGFFVESTDMGKLYLNYPMVEAFYHMKSIPDPDYNSYISTLIELKAKGYKARVNREKLGRDYSGFAVNKEECDTVILQNIDKARFITSLDLPGAQDILEAQVKKMRNEQTVAVLCTCAFYITDYNPALIGPLTQKPPV